MQHRGARTANCCAKAASFLELAASVDGGADAIASIRESEENDGRSTCLL